MKNSHFLHALLPIVFVITWFLDTQFFKISIFLNDFVPFLIRIIIFSMFLILAFILIYLSHKTLFKNHEAPKTLINEGILAHIRNPMYLGFLLIYISLICLSISLISIAIFVIVFLIYNKMVNFEEKILETLFGEEYLIHKKKVPKWIPRISNQ